MSEELAALLERFRRGAELVAVTMTGAAGPELDFVTAPGKWGIRQIVCHVADSELVMAQRFRRVIAEENPTLTAFDQEAWARNLDYHRRKITERERIEKRKADVEMVRAALEKSVSATPRASLPSWIEKPDLLAWLRSL